MKIGVVLPTRGLVFTRTEDYIESLRPKYEIKVYRSWDLPIPDGHNSLTEQALKDGCDYIFLLEEDVVPPPGAFEKMLAVNADIACTDYGVAGWGCVTTASDGKVLWCGVGCTLVKKRVFEALEAPYFRADKVLRENDWTWVELPEEYVKNKNYGSLDIWFCWQATNKGFEIVQVEGECAHLQLDALGQKQVNNGCHQISERPRITKKQVKNI